MVQRPHTAQRLEPTNAAAYTVFMDEVGDVKCHPRSHYKNPSVFPIHTILGVVFRSDDYRDVVDPGIAAIKVKHFGSSSVHIHSRDIRHRNGIFKSFLSGDARLEFYRDLWVLLRRTPPVIVSSSIDKRRLAERAALLSRGPGATYEFGDIYLKNFEYLLERVGHYVGGEQTHLVFETRTRGDSERIEQAFERIRGGGTRYHGSCRFSAFDSDISFHTKEDNINGLQLADMCAYPFAIHCQDSGRDNRMFEALCDFVYPGEFGLYGLKEWPV